MAQLFATGIYTTIWTLPAKASHDDRISGRGELDRASPKKMCEKFWTLSIRALPQNLALGMKTHIWK